MRLNGWAGDNLLCSNSFLYVQLVPEACYFVTIIALLSLALKKNWARLNHTEHIHQKIAKITSQSDSRAASRTLRGAGMMIMENMEMLNKVTS